MITARMS